MTLLGLPVGAATPEVALWALETEVRGKTLIGFGSMAVVGTVADAVTDKDSAPEIALDPLLISKMLSSPELKFVGAMDISLLDKS